MKSYERIASHVLDTCNLVMLRRCIIVNDIGVVAWISHNKKDWINAIESCNKTKIDLTDIPHGKSIDQLIFDEIYKSPKMNF